MLLRRRLWARNRGGGDGHGEAALPLLRPLRLSVAAAVALFLGEAVVGLAWNAAAGVWLVLCTAVLFVGVRATYALLAHGAPDEVDPEAAARLLLIEPRTGLPTLQQLVDHSTREIARLQRYGTSLSLARVDIEGLGDIRATWGGDVADQVIKHVADVMRSVTRASDFLCCLGEGRFAALLVQCSRAQAGAFAERVGLAVASRPLQSGDGWRLPLQLTVKSAGFGYDAARFRGAFDFLSAAGCDAGADGPARAPEAGDPGGTDYEARDYDIETGATPDFVKAHRRHPGRRAS